MRKEKFAVFTMDVEAFGDTECVFNSKENLNVDLLDGLDEYVKILDKHDIKGTFFTVGELAPKIKDRLHKIIKNGHRLALHNFKHIPPLHINIDEFRTQIYNAKESLSNMFNTKIEGFRAPCFSMDNQRMDVLRELGFKYDSSNLGFSKARHTRNINFDNYTHLGDGIFTADDFFEFSLSNEKIFGAPYPISGGGYVRLCNWGFIKGVIKHYIKNNDYYVFYLHPFELTKKKIPFFKKMKAYDRFYLQYGIKSYAKHVEQIIILLKNAGYKFVTFEELSEILARENEKIGNA